MTSTVTNNVKAAALIALALAAIGLSVACADVTGPLFAQPQDVPSVLVELGYLSSGEDERALTSEEWRSKVADAIVESVKAFFAKHHVSVPG